jgi:hypothetical protein
LRARPTATVLPNLPKPITATFNMRTSLPKA